jgi:hypothetical protein
MNAGVGVPPSQHGLHSGGPGHGHYSGAETEGYGTAGAPGYGAGTGTGHHGAGVPADHMANAYPGTASAGGFYPGPDSGRGVSASGEPGIPPTHTVNHGSTTGSGSGSAFAGKVEQAVGTLLSSQSLKAKGLQKEEEARALKAQSRELTAAEQLEKEAAMRRERAVAHGAHPDNRHVGGRPL